MYSNSRKDDLNIQQKVVQQLRRECKVDRMKISQVASDLMHYCEEKQVQDPLLLKIPANENPFKERRTTCTVL